MTTTAPDVNIASLVITIILSAFGFLWAIFSYIFLTKWFCCTTETLAGKIAGKIACSCNCGKETEDDKPLLDRKTLVGSLVALHVIGKLVIVALDCTYLAVVGVNFTFDTNIVNGSVFEFNTKEAGASFANLISFFLIAYEVAVIFALPIYSLPHWICCIRKGDAKLNCKHFLQYLRGGDLTFAFFFAPFSNVNLFYLGGPWYVLIVVRLAFYSLVFATSVIAGIRFIFIFCCCIPCCECACSDKHVEVRNYKHLFKEIGLKLVAIGLKLMTCSSALATYLSIAIVVSSYGIAFRIAYFSFTVIRGASALFSLGFNAALLRREALTEAKKEDKGNRCSRLLKWLDEKEPHAHVSFVLDMATYVGLLTLNFMIVHALIATRP